MLSQGIAGPRFEKPEEVVEWMGAMQAQDIRAAKWAVGLRIVIQNDEVFAANNDSLTLYLRKENKELKSKNEELNREIGKLEGQIIELKKHVHVEDVAKCAIASGSDLVDKSTL